jgi:hypothetical protein
MAYPQPNADQYCIKGYQYFRLLTPLSSPGDIYESAQSGLAFSVGPESDIANVVVQYFDDQIPDFLQQTTISPRRAFIGRIDARNESSYSPSGTPGRIMFWAADLYDPNFRPTGFNPAQDHIQFIQPQIDIIQYFKPNASLIPERIDKQYLFQNYQVGPTWIVVPFYGRKYCYAEITNRAAVTALSYAIVGVNYAITDDSSTTPYHQQTAIQAPATIAAGASNTKIITATATGTFDALAFSITTDGPAPLAIRVSDNE